MRDRLNILVIDGQGGKLGCQLVRSILEKYPNAQLTAVGTNSAAAAAMAKAGAHRAAAGENPVVVACRGADIIIGPIGIVIADSLLGEITPAMAIAVARSSAVRILIPANRCENLVAGVPDLSLSALIADAMNKLDALIQNSCLQGGVF